MPPKKRGTKRAKPDSEPEETSKKRRVAKADQVEDGAIAEVAEETKKPARKRAAPKAKTPQAPTRVSSRVSKKTEKVLEAEEEKAPAPAPAEITGDKAEAMETNGDGETEVPEKKAPAKKRAAPKAKAAPKKKAAPKAKAPPKAKGKTKKGAKKAEEEDEEEPATEKVEEQAIEKEEVAATKPTETETAPVVVEMPTENAFAKLMLPGWRCAVCDVNNKLDITVCAACETPKEGTVAATSASSAAAAPAFTFGCTSEAAPATPMENAFAKLIPPGWRCTECDVNNKLDATVCASCETPKAGTAAAAAASASTSSAPAFTFGVASDAPSGTSEAAAPSTAPTFSFGSTEVTFGV